MNVYLTVIAGRDKGTQFALDPARVSKIGRESYCDIILKDRVASRAHAEFFFDDDDWHVRDCDSRNGTLVNGQKADNARLQDRSVVTIGETDLQLHVRNLDDVSQEDVGATLVYDLKRDEGFAHKLETEPLREVVRTELLLDLYQLSLTLLDNHDSVEVIDTVLELLHQRTSTNAICLSLDSGDGTLKPLRSLPADSSQVITVSKKLTRRVIRGGVAMWLTQDSDPKLLKEAHQDKPHDWTQVIFVPLVQGDERLGLLHLYRNDTGFTHADFDMAVLTSRLLTTGLQRASENDLLRAERKNLANRNADNDELIGESPVMVKLKERIARIGNAKGAVLVRGESGSGKELVARAVHRSSQRAKRPMLTVNCAAIPANLIESQLFGHKKGAFTGADTDHVGWFQQAHLGTLFLDEVGELTLEGQAKLLRILEGHPFLPVGASEEVLVDVRVIAATNRDLAEFVRDGKFREDLFYRLSVFELLVPPLRQRGSDIETLIDHFLDHFRKQHGRKSLELSDDARRRLCEYAWPGNVRQLRNVIDSAVVMADDPAIQAEDVGLRDAGLDRLDTLKIDEWEKRLINKALKQTSGNVPEAAKLLGVSRATAYRKISDYGIER